MAYYDALIAKWATLSPGTTDQKLAQLNAITQGSTSTKALISPTQIINCIQLADFKALTQLQQSQLANILAAGGTHLDASPGTTVRAWFQDAFAGKATTLAALAALVAPFDTIPTPWWQANGYAGPIGTGDLEAAGLS